MSVDPDSIPVGAVNAYLSAAWPSDDYLAGLAAFLDALGCEWDDDKGNNTHRRIVGAWIPKGAPHEPVA